MMRRKWEHLQHEGEAARHHLYIFLTKICITPTSRGLTGSNSFDGTDYMMMDKMNATQKGSQKILFAL